MPANELAKVLRRDVSPKILAELAVYGSNSVGNKELNPIGIWLDFDSNDLSLSVSLEEQSSSQTSIDFDGEYRKPTYSEYSFIAWHNIFNFSDDYDITPDSDNTNLWLGEWISAINIGGPLGLNLEAAAYVEGIQSNEELDSPSVYRGDILMFIDRPDYPMRFSVGDLSSSVTGHMPSLNLGGIAIERLWSRLQPDRNIQNGGAQSIYLRESANVYIYINNIYFTDLRLRPGRYDIEDLPLDQGSNDIRIEIEYQSGQREVINYSQFFNARLLREGISDFSLYAGVFSSIEDNVYDYDETQYAVQGFYEYGITDDVTVGVNSTWHPDGQIFGSILNLGSNFGNIGSRFSGLTYSDVDEIGMIVSVDYEQAIFGNLDFSSPNFRLSAETFSDYRSTPWNLDETLSNGIRVIGDYSYFITPTINYTVRGNWFKDVDLDEDNYYAAVEATWSPWRFTFTSGIDYSFNNGSSSNDIRYYFVGRWDWFSSENYYSAAVEYQSRPNSVRTSFSKLSEYTPNSFGYELRSDITPEFQEYSGKIDYVANRFTTEVEYQTNYIDFSENRSQRISGRLSTAVSVFDSNIAWGRSYGGPAAIVDVHNSLEAPVLINGFDEDRPESIATRSLSGLVPIYGAHGTSNISISVPDAPIGYDYGPDRHSIVAGSYTGHLLTVGSNASKTVLGKLIDKNGEPIVLRNGVLLMETGEKSFFTNRGGRFALDGMTSGNFEIIIKGNPSYRGIISIPDNEDNLIYLESTQLQLQGVNDD
ncbi:hypothetical protein VIN01S_15140 [Vibrio inusitatus NBRC 102082]|uniref:Uncharacterized protein n=1 Tax=Vibrio inusitatus NBRC 102082 TaxID=1219070 RepID=A0A4Y3HVE2_9VIBR|nr:hypothetical protein VIN01S_15140 [Vibrio inusitatus NBRC 102082]